MAACRGFALWLCSVLAWLWRRCEFSRLPLRKNEAHRRWWMLLSTCCSTNSYLWAGTGFHAWSLAGERLQHANARQLKSESRRQLIYMKYNRFQRTWAWHTQTHRTTRCLCTLTAARTALATFIQARLADIGALGTFLLQVFECKCHAHDTPWELLSLTFHKC